MAQLEKLQKSFDILKDLLNTRKFSRVIEKSSTPLFRRQNTPLSKNDYIFHCNTIADVIALPSTKTHEDFFRFLSTAIETLLVLSDNDDPDVRLVASDGIDKICLSLYESNLNRVHVEFYKEIEKNGSSRSLRVALNKFADLCSHIRPSKYRAFASKLFPCIVKTLNRSDDELLQETLLQFVLKVFPILASYATDKEIMSVLNAYLPNLNCSSSATRRSVALSMVTLCENTRRPHQFFYWVINNLLNLLSTLNLSASENNEKLLAGIFNMFKFAFPKITNLLQSTSTTVDELMIENLIFIYQHLLTNIKYSTSNIIIVSALEALIEFVNTLPYNIHQRIVNQSENLDTKFCWNYSRSPSSLSTLPRLDRKYGSNLSISSSINYVENINDEFSDEVFKTSGISLNSLVENDLKSSDYVSEYGDSEMGENLDDTYSEVNFDQESEQENSLYDNKMAEFSDMSQFSSANLKNEALSIDMNSENIDSIGKINEIGIDHFNLGPVYTLEYAAKLICLKFLLPGEDGQLIADDMVRVSIKALALSCFSSLVHIFPEALFLQVFAEQKSQYFIDVLLYSTHPDPNIKGLVAILIGKFLDKVLSLPVPYADFVSSNFAGDFETVQIASLLDILIRTTQDTSAIAIKQALISLQLFFPKYLGSGELNNAQTISILEMMISFKNNSYWLVKVELINLLSCIPYNTVNFIVQTTQIHQSKNILSFSKSILEEIVFFFAFDGDYRVRQALYSSLDRFVQNLTLNSYLLNNDPINMNTLNLMHANFYHQHDSKHISDFFPILRAIMSPLDYVQKVNSTFSINILDRLKQMNVSSNLLYLVKRFLFQLTHSSTRQTMLGAITALRYLSQQYSPCDHSAAWQLDYHMNGEDNNKPINTIHFLIELLIKNQTIMLDLNAHQSLTLLIVDLFEGLVCCHAKQLQDTSARKLQTEPQLFNYISPLFAKYIQQYFIHLLKIIVAHSAIAEDNSAIFTTFIHNLHSKNQSSLSALLRRRNGKFYYLKEKDNNTLKKELSNKGSKKHESFAYDPLYHRLFEILKSFYRSKKVSVGNKAEKYAFLTTSLNAMSKLLEMIDHNFVLNYLEDLLIYLRLIFHLDPTATICTVKQLLKCIFSVNYVSLFTDFCNDQESGMISWIQLNENSTTTFKWQDVNSLYNSCLSMPYIKFNNFYKIYRSQSDSCDYNGGFYTWLKERVYSKLSKTFNLNDSASTAGGESDIKTTLVTKIQFFEPLVIKSLKFYTHTSDHKFQSHVAELLAQLVQLHVNYCKLDSDNIFINFVMKQFEFLENVSTSQSYDPLMKRLFYFLTILSNGNYASEFVNIPKVIQLCDGLIANGHHQMALEGLYIIFEDIFYSKNKDNVDSFSDLEAQREVLLAYCFKLHDYHLSFDLLNSIVKFYKFSNPARWTSLSLQIADLVTCKLTEDSIKLESVESFECLQTLLLSLDPIVFNDTVNLLVHIFAKLHDKERRLSSSQCLAKMSILLKLALLNLNEEDFLSKTAKIRETIDFSVLSKIGEMGSLNDDSTPIEDIISSFLVCILQMAIIELNDDLFNYKLKPNKSDFMVYLMSQYTLVLVFIFQSGFYPKITQSATTLIRANNQTIAFNEVVFDFARTNGLFLKMASLFPILSIFWLNLLYILNYQQIHQTLSKLIEYSGEENQCRHLNRIHSHTVKRFSLILFCDYLTEHLENVEYLSWLIINHLKEIICLCHELPVKEFINSIHRKSSSSGLFLQAIKSRCSELLSNPLFASRVLECLYHSHSNQSIPLVMLLLDKFLFNKQLALYYKCNKYAETIAANRLMSMYDLNVNRLADTEELSCKALLTLKDINNLKKILKNTSYVKLIYTIQMIKNKFFDTHRRKKSAVVKDPLSEQRTVNQPEINKKWFMDILKLYWSTPQSSINNTIYFFNKLSNDDIEALIDSDQFLIQNFKQVLIYLAEKTHGRKNLNQKSKFSSHDTNRTDLTRKILFIFSRIMRNLVNKFPLVSSLLDRKYISQSQIDKIEENINYSNALLPFLPPFQYLMCNLTVLEEQVSSCEISNSNLDMNLLIVYSTFLYQSHNNLDPIPLIDILNLIKNSLLNQIFFSKISKTENIHLQLNLIDSIFHLMSKCYDITFNVNLPEELTSFGNESLQFKHIFDDINKMLQLFHSLEVPLCNKKSEQLPPIFHKTLQDVILLMARFPFVNSLLCIPYNLYSSKQVGNFWKEVTFNGDFHTNIPIVGSQYLIEVDLFRQFSFRITSIGFTNRIQFEEIWMTLLGVFSENYNFILQNKNETDLHENILLARLVIQTQTALLLKTRDSSTKTLTLIRRVRQSFGDRFEFIRESLQRKYIELTQNLQSYNNSYAHSLDHFSAPVSVESLLENIANSGDSFARTTLDSNDVLDSDNKIDLYSCLHFMMDLYLQTVSAEVSSSTINFPILTEIAKSCLSVSDLFTEKSLFMKLLQILHELTKIVELYEDDILSQYVIVVLAKTYSVLAINDEVLEKIKKLIIEQYFKDFFLPTRIGAVRSIKYFCSFPNLISNKDLLSIAEYISKHFDNEHCIPSSYSAEYVEELWSLSFCLIEKHSVALSVGFDFNDKVSKALQRNLLRSKYLNNLRVVTVGLEQLLCLGHVNAKEVVAINEAIVKKMKSCTNQQNTILLLNLYVLTSYLLGPPNFGGMAQPTNDELFVTMEQLSTIFEPLKRCNSLEASIICQVMGHFLVDFFPAQDLLNKCIGEFLSNQQNHYKYLTDILFVIFNKFQNDFQHNDTAQDWVILSLSSFTQLIPISHALWALTCFLVSASQNHWIRASFPNFQYRFGQFNERDKRFFFTICNNFYNEIKSDENKRAFIKTFQKAACVPNSPYFDVLKYLCDI